MTEYLICHTSNSAFTKNKAYEIIENKHSYFKIINDKGDGHILTKERDWDGETYKDYMSLEEDADLQCINCEKKIWDDEDYKLDEEVGIMCKHCFLDHVGISLYDYYGA